MRGAPAIRLTLTLALACLAAAAAEAPALERARELYRHGLLEDARAEAHKVLYSEASQAGKAAALDLLGLIAVDLGDLEAARQAWADLVERYPDPERVAEARTKLALVDAALAAGARRPPAPPPAPKALPGPPAPPPTPSSAADAAGSQRGPQGEPPPAPPPAAPPSPAAPAHGVLVAGSGNLDAAHRDALLALLEFLVGHGVEARGAPGGLAEVEALEAALPHLSEAVRREHAAGSLYLVTRFGYRERMELTCHDPEGRRLWRENVSGGSGFGEKRMNPVLAERLHKKIESRLGGPCLELEGAP